MTQAEITEKSNSFKIKLNDCEHNIDKYHQSIESFSKFKTYFENSNEKAKKYKKCSFAYICFFSVLCVAGMFLSIPLSTLFLIVSIVSLERFIFFTRVTKKFEHCISFLNNVITNLTTKQSNFVAERAYALEEIMKLEKEMPEVITFLNKSTPIIEEEINVLEI